MNATLMNLIRSICRTINSVFSFNRKFKKGFLPGETIRRAAALVYEKGVSIPPIDAEPTPLGALGMAIGLLRRRKNITHAQFARKIGCTIEELLALESGMLPADDYKKYLSAIQREIDIPEPVLRLIARQ